MPRTTSQTYPSSPPYQTHNPTHIYIIHDKSSTLPGSTHTLQHSSYITSPPFHAPAPCALSIRGKTATHASRAQLRGTLACSPAFASLNSTTGCRFQGTLAFLRVRVEFRLLPSATEEGKRTDGVQELEGKGFGVLRCLEGWGEVSIAVMMTLVR
ncbi:uncharacterized protein CC84DRAFT_1163612 [Paraphaeosphaeria sporulosa]|uniref:Uncharacterized protein n=1 Tax=Paraphaeosphaeria sporulosa TaxID=1460663 RepID=A0A177CKR0_9PLEO|nr:uncharacterized protein CC84DRAFT_1163612 [Paraphaeosphaeria sporulosa]OAG07458.1 hypothetical protein CC84DRAFT_1163612 [Paraphaeosphaeria sporulosa]